jgi:hypothetical protein
MNSRSLMAKTIGFEGGVAHVRLQDDAIADDI